MFHRLKDTLDGSLDLQGGDGKKFLTKVDHGRD